MRTERRAHDDTDPRRQDVRPDPDNITPLGDKIDRRPRAVDEGARGGADSALVADHPAERAGGGAGDPPRPSSPSDAAHPAGELGDPATATKTPKATLRARLVA